MLSAGPDAGLPDRAPATGSNTQTRDAAGVRPRVPAPAVAAAAPTGEAEGLRQATATIAGSVLDQSGGSLPGAQLTLTDTKTGTQVRVDTDAAGTFAFRDLQPSRYELVVGGLPGFTTVSNVLTLPSGAAVRRAITLHSEASRRPSPCAAPVHRRQTVHGRGRLDHPNRSLTVAAATRFQQFVTHSIAGDVFPVLSAQEAPGVAPIRVGGNIGRRVRSGTSIRSARRLSLQWISAVSLTGRVGVDGFVNDLTPVAAEAGAEPPMELTESALDAVRQWMFTPTLLNGRRWRPTSRCTWSSGGS